MYTPTQRKGNLPQSLNLLRKRQRNLPQEGPEKTKTLALWDHVLHVPQEASRLAGSFVGDSRHRTRLIIAEDNEAVIKIMLKGRTNALKHLPRTHKINLDWLVEGIRSEQVKIRYCKTSAQLADMMTKHFTKPEVWSALLHICQMY